MNTTNQTDVAYRVLARKYRPKDFDDLIGQMPMVQTLTNAFEANRIAQAYMLTGVRGVGKTTTARILARALNYKTDSVNQPSVDLSTLGEHCQAIMDGRHMDVIEMDAASHTGIADIREIIEQVRYAPAYARYKVYIIDEVHMLSLQAFNGLLKTLEEPPEHVKFIFATTEIRKVPITVLSRCQRFDLRRIEVGTLIEHFRKISALENVTIDNESLSLIARSSEGSVRDGLSLLDQAISHGSGNVEASAVLSMLGLADRNQIIDIFNSIMSGDVEKALEGFQKQYNIGADPVAILTDLADFCHLVTRLKFVASAADDPALNEVERTRGLEFSKALSVPVLSRIWQMLLKGISETEAASRPVAAAEMVLIRLAYAANLPSPEEASRKMTDAMKSGGADNSMPRSGNGAGHGNGSNASAVSQQTISVGQAGAGNTARALLQTVSTNEAVMPSTARQVEQSPNLEIELNSLEDVADLAQKNRDLVLKSRVRKNLRFVSIKPGHLEIGITQDAPGSLPGELSKKLEKWTGRRWIISINKNASNTTLVEDETKRLEARVSDAQEDPDVAAIIKRFPGSKITDVKITTKAEEILDETLSAGDRFDDENLE